MLLNDNGKCAGRRPAVRKANATTKDKDEKKSLAAAAWDETCAAVLF